jgi:hypothetical protein
MHSPIIVSYCSTALAIATTRTYCSVSRARDKVSSLITESRPYVALSRSYNRFGKSVFTSLIALLLDSQHGIFIMIVFICRPPRELIGKIRGIHAQQ